MKLRELTCKTEEQIIWDIAEAAKDYKTFEEYIQDAGFEFWMYEYSETENLKGTDDITEEEWLVIKSIQQRGFDRSRTLE